LDVENILLVSNGTLALQIAYRALNIKKGETNVPITAITTPFTYIATASSMKWEGIDPLFVDIDPKTWCLAPEKIESSLQPDTRVIVPVHVFGNACEVEKIDVVAKRHNLKVIYDAAHAFGVTYKGESLLKWGDAATLSFHATKVFHSIEGGAIVFKRKEDLNRAKALINFGINEESEIGDLGINAKMSEFNAAMGLCVLDELGENLWKRSKAWKRYEQSLSNRFELQHRPEFVSNNWSYFPLLAGSEYQLEHILKNLLRDGVSARRYFYPSLEKLSFLTEKTQCKISQDVASRILCLPLYSDLSSASIDLITEKI
jgi:dTDP-4-amino-4,6-dideoxygalactose transaminase